MRDPVLEGLTPRQAAFLNMLAGPESAGAYNVRYTPSGGSKFFDLSRHPRILEPTKTGEKSSAAGRYQFTATTWDRLGGGDFSPANQDRMALKLAAQDYGRVTGRDFMRDLETEGPTPRMFKALGPTWAGLKDNPGKATKWYQDTLARYGDDPSTTSPELMAYVNSKNTPAKAATAIDKATTGGGMPGATAGQSATMAQLRKMIEMELGITEAVSEPPDKRGLFPFLTDSLKSFGSAITGNPPTEASPRSMVAGDDAATGAMAGAVSPQVAAPAPNQFMTSEMDRLRNILMGEAPGPTMVEQNA